MSFIGWGTELMQHVLYTWVNLWVQCHALHWYAGPGLVLAQELSLGGNLSAVPAPWLR